MNALRIKRTVYQIIAMPVLTAAVAAVAACGTAAPAAIGTGTGRTMPAAGASATSTRLSTGVSTAMPAGATTAAATLPARPQPTASTAPAVVSGDPTANGVSPPSAATPTVASTKAFAPPPSGGLVPAALLPDDRLLHWAAATATHTVGWDQAANDSLCYGLNRARQIQETDFIPGSGPGMARQQTYTYPTPAAADAAYAAVLAQMAGCQTQLRAQQQRSVPGTPPDAAVATTAGTGTAQAWSLAWTGAQTPMSTAGVQTDHVYLARHGATLAVVEVDDHAPAPAWSPADDGAVLAAVAAIAAS